MKVFVIGKLGDLVKRFLELQFSASENANPIMLAELTANRHVIEAWPIEDENAMVLLMESMRLNLAKLRAAQEDMLSLTFESSCKGMWATIIEYNKYKQAVKSNISDLNKLGQHIGPVPLLEVDDANVEQT